MWSGKHLYLHYASYMSSMPEQVFLGTLCWNVCLWTKDFLILVFGSFSATNDGPQAQGPSHRPLVMFWLICVSMPSLYFALLNFIFRAFLLFPELLPSGSIGNDFHTVSFNNRRFSMEVCNYGGSLDWISPMYSNEMFNKTINLHQKKTHRASVFVSCR